ncbi:hypothetical protein TNCV_414371 [Trichonephila clavipes]|nr:hypothetical protein TNCV_414371 [Trichonephila clavipes]
MYASKLLKCLPTNLDEFDKVIDITFGKFVPVLTKSDPPGLKKEVLVLKQRVVQQPTFIDPQGALISTEYTPLAYVHRDHPHEACFRLRDLGAFIMLLKETAFDPE